MVSSASLTRYSLYDNSSDMQLGKNWKRRAESLYSVFEEAMKSRDLMSYETLGDFHVRQVKEMIDNIGEQKAQEVIVFAVNNWEDLRKEPGSSLSTDPNFHQMIVKWRYGKWINIMKIKHQKKVSSDFVESNEVQGD